MDAFRRAVIIAAVCVFLVLLSFTAASFYVSGSLLPKVTAYTLMLSHDEEGWERQWLMPETVFTSSQGSSVIYILRERAGSFGDIEYYVEEFAPGELSYTDSGIAEIPLFPNYHTNRVVTGTDGHLFDGAAVRWANPESEHELVKFCEYFSCVNEDGEYDTSCYLASAALSYIPNISEEIDALFGEEGLTILFDYYDNEVNLAVDIFKREYPDIPLNIIKLENDQYIHEKRQAIYASLMAGRGPDILSTLFMPDIDILARNGIFADLSDFYDDDAQTSEGLHPFIMDAGVFGGKRHLFPLSYTVPMLLTTEEILAKAGIDKNNMKSYGGFLTETARATEQGIPLAAFHTYDVGDNGFESVFPGFTLQFGGLSAVNWETRRIDLNLHEIRQTMEWQKIVMQPYRTGGFAGIGYDEGFRRRGDYGTKIDDALRTIWDGEALFLSYGNYGDISPDSSIDNFKIMMRLGTSPVQLRIPSASGGTTARVVSAMGVRANSRHISDAYKFIRIMLSHEVQAKQLLRRRWPQGIPVRYSAVEGMYLDQIGTTISGTMAGGMDMVKYSYPREDWEKYLEILETVDTVIWTEKWTDILCEEFAAYFAGSRSYDECLDNAKRRIEIYLSEF